QASETFDYLADHGPNALLATTILGLIAASQGRGDPAADLLNSILYAKESSPALKAVAHIGIAYAFYWAGNYAVAADYFDEVPRCHPDSPLADDARYGKAWSQQRAGDIVAAREGLTALAARASPDAEIAPALVDLSPDAVFRERMRRYPGATSI